VLHHGSCTGWADRPNMRFQKPVAQAAHDDVNPARWPKRTTLKHDSATAREGVKHNFVVFFV